MTQFLPPNLLALFAPRDPIPFLPPAAKLPHEKKNKGYVGIGSFLDYFEDPNDTPPPTRVETREERLERRRRERAEQVAYKLEQEIAVWDPHNIPTATVDPFKSLFVARINYDTSESKLRREFEVYGPIKKIVMTHNTVNGKPRGYAFIEYEHERDMHLWGAGDNLMCSLSIVCAIRYHCWLYRFVCVEEERRHVAAAAYKHADGKKIDGRRVLVDVERGRTVKGWMPRRLGGGLGGTRRGGPEVNLKHSGREDNERERERYRLEREREAAGGRERDRERDRDREREVRRRSRSRDRERDRKRRSRSRSRDRKRRRSRERVKDPDIEEVEERPRDRDRDRDRKRRRSHSRDRDRKRERRDRDRGDRDKERERKRDPDQDEVRIKQEPLDDYPDYSNYNENDYEEAPIKFEKQEQDRMSQMHNDEQEVGQEHNGSNYEYETEQDY